MPSLSAIIITKNAATDIRRCLESIKWVDEIIVLDSGSTDDTQNICREYTENVFVTDWPGYGVQKNRALAKASSDWILSIDSDEWVSDALKTEICTAIENDKYAGYFIPRQSKYCGKLIKYGAWGSDKVLRLFKKEKGQFDDRIVHEKVLINGKMGLLSQPLLHDTNKSPAEVMDKINRYSSLNAEIKHNQGKKGSLTKAIAHGFWAFFRSYFIQRGFLDGKEGFMLAISNAEASYYCYIKLMHRL